jgi:hypothetical protein
VSNVLKPLRTLFTAIGGALPAANPLHRGVFAVKKAAATEDELHVGLRDSSDVMQWRRMLTKTYADTLYGVPLTVQEGGVTTDATVGTINFDGSDFNLTESPEDTVAVALAYGTSAGTPAEGNHAHTDYVEVAGDTMTGPLIIDVDNANAFVVRKADDTKVFFIESDSTGVNNIIAITNGGTFRRYSDDGTTVTAALGANLILQESADIRLFSDAGSTQKCQIDGATGDIDTEGMITLGSAGVQILTGTGDPEGVHTAVVGSLFLRTDGGAATTLYVKETGSGNTGWSSAA